MKNRGVGILPAWLSGVVLVVVVIAGGLAATRLTIVQDITALLPRDDRDSVATHAREWGLMKRVILVIGPGEPGSERLTIAADAVAGVLAGIDGVAEVFCEVDMEGVRKGAGLLMKRGASLYRPSGGKIDGEVAAKRLSSLKERLASPEALVMQEYLLADPLGMARDALRGLEAAGAAMGATVRHGHLMSADERYALVFVKIGFDPMEVDRSTRFVEDLDVAIDGSLRKAGVEDLNVHALGGVHFTASSAGVIMSDIRFAFILTIIGVLLIFTFFFRRVVIIPAALLPGGVGIVVALGVMGAMGTEIHALTIGFAATITGISVDYAIHLLYRAFYQEKGTTREKMGKALAAIAMPVALGCGTTVAAFALVATSKFPGMRQLAIFSVISIPTALAVTLLMLPAFHRFLLSSKTALPGLADRVAALLVGMGTGRRSPVAKSAVIGGFVAVFGLGAWGSFTAPRTGDPRAMGHVDDDLAGREAKIKEIFPGLADQALIVASGPDRERALLANDALYNALTQAGFEPGEIFSVSPFMPAMKTQERSLKAARELFRDPDGSLEAAFLEVGFRAEYFLKLRKTIEGQNLTIEDYEGTSLERFVAESVREGEGRWDVLTRLRAGDDALIDRLVKVAASVPGCRVVSERLETRAALSTMQVEIIRMLGIWLVVALVMLTVARRSLLFGLRAVAPAVMGVACGAGFFGLVGRPLTPVSAAALTLVMGLGIDYGIFMQGGRRATVREAAPAVLASAFTTLAAFGVLASARTKAMADLGLIIMVGVLVAVFTAIVLVPLLSPGRAEKAVDP